ncbi:HDIG domain-containing metalloprotein [Conexibacter woesei]|uniref:Polynucleotide adenylyltransferase/metal dependent phosphohydrolase n=1 Tax=Conexibacter woesei (strain DSM 14684 / CCUG 47730 / CIP 108061 / JCM 11494 / NBRC 100937 / ID131577) TaxID=469383 RepID=D3F335_CONWI|nr:HDIG domain-containing metalloprotein [Conexibacter woesei]ADB50315.1 polynucleotide adenylyltransferase/metal dependent phosphohydrolase [Conexibacter woesei DSM 14684]
MSAPADTSAGAPDPLAVAREALAGTRTWLVGGAVRDRLLDRVTKDLDLAVDGDVEAAARGLGRAARAAVFPLSEAFGAWRVVAREGAWQADLAPLTGATIEQDLAQRDFTVNAIAEPLAGGDPIDPTGGAADLAARRLRMVSPGAFSADPVRVMRLPRFASELGLEVEVGTLAAARLDAPRLREVAQERVFAELRRVVGAPDPLHGLELMGQLGATAAVLPELDALRGVEQSAYHHLDVHDHTLAVLAETVALEGDPAAVFGPERGERLRELLAQPFSDELSRGTALRFGALLHDIAKPQTRGVMESGRVTFFDHDAQGAELTREILTRLRTSEKLRAHVAALARHHLRLGFLVHERPLTRRDEHRYLRRTTPVEVDVTLLSVADRLATRGRKSDEAIAKHLDLARELIGPALAWESGERPLPLIRGDELADALEIPRGPRLGTLLAELEAAQYAGEVSTREQAVEHARAALAAAGDGE